MLSPLWRIRPVVSTAALIYRTSSLLSRILIWLYYDIKSLLLVLFSWFNLGRYRDRMPGMGKCRAPCRAWVWHDVSRVGHTARARDRVPLEHTFSIVSSSGGHEKIFALWKVRIWWGAYGTHFFDYGWNYWRYFDYWTNVKLRLVAEIKGKCRDVN